MPGKGPGEAGRSEEGGEKTEVGQGPQAGRPSPTPRHQPRPRDPRSGPTAVPIRPPALLYRPTVRTPAAVRTHSWTLTVQEPKNRSPPTAPRIRPVPAVRSRHAPRAGGLRHHAAPPRCQRCPRLSATRSSSLPPSAGFQVRRRRLLRVLRLCAGAVPLPRRLAI